MANVFLFIPDPISGGGSSDGNQTKDVQPIVSPFALSSAEWRNIRSLVGAVSGVQGPANALLSQDPCASSALQAAWHVLSDQVRMFGTDLLPAMKMCIGLVQSYAKSNVPSEYGALKRVLEAAGPRLTSEEAAFCATILRRLRDEASACTERAKAIAPRFGSFADAVTNLRTTFNGLPRNPPVKVTMPSIPNVCLTYDGNFQTIAGDINSSDARHSWIVEYLPPGMAFRLISAADTSKMLTIDRAPWMRNPFLDRMAQQAPRPHVVAADKVGDGMIAFVLDGSRLHPAGYGTHVLDCSGNDGWGDGTPVLAFAANDGINQHWTFTPAPRPWREVAFHDCMATPVQFAQSSDALNHLLGDWSAIVDDLTAGIQSVLKSVELKVPFIGALQVQQAMDGWADVAAEADASLASLG